MDRFPCLFGAVHDQPVIESLSEIVSDRLPVNVTAHVGLVGLKLSYARSADVWTQPGTQRSILRQEIVGDEAASVDALSVRFVVPVSIGQTGDGRVLMSPDPLAEQTQLHRDGVLHIGRIVTALVVLPEIEHIIPEVFSQDPSALFSVALGQPVSSQHQMDVHIGVPYLCLSEAAVDRIVTLLLQLEQPLRGHVPSLTEDLTEPVMILELHAQTALPVIVDVAEQKLLLRIYQIIQDGR